MEAGCWTVHTISVKLVWARWVEISAEQGWGSKNGCSLPLQSRKLSAIRGEKKIQQKTKPRILEALSWEQGREKSVSLKDTFRSIYSYSLYGT